MITALIEIDKDKHKITKEEFNLKGTSFFAQRAIKEVIRMFSRKIARVLDTGVYKEFLYVHDGKEYRFCTKDYGFILVAVVVGSRPSYTVLKMMDEASSGDFKAVMREHEDWREKCPIEAVERELEETKAVLKDTLENVLNRGEKLDKLIDQSEELSMHSKALFRAAKRQNRCCKMG